MHRRINPLKADTNDADPIPNCIHENHLVAPIAPDDGGAMGMEFLKHNP